MVVDNLVDKLMILKSVSDKDSGCISGHRGFFYLSLEGVNIGF